MTILLVDDEPVALRFLQLVLERQRYTVATASSAAEALAWLGQAHGVDLVITDQNLGGMSGLELASTLREDARWRRLPVILCTAAADRATVEEALRRGIRHFVVKPIKPPQLIEKVERALAERIQTLPNRYVAMAELGMSDPEYRSFLRASRERLGQLASEIAEARAADRGDAAREAALRIAEPARLLQAERMLAAVDELERAADEHTRELLLDLVTAELGSLDEALEVAQRPQLPGRPG